MATAFRKQIGIGEIMQSVIAFFRHPLFISCLGLLAFSFVIWFGGPLIFLGENKSAPLAGVSARLLVIVCIVSCFVIYQLMQRGSLVRRNQKMAKALSEPISGDDVAADEEVKLLSERFGDALAILKKAELRNRRGRQLIYELPWYIIIGPPGSGKTTALVNSGLKFPLAEKLGKSPLQGVAGTRHCDWWFTNEAVFIDTAGRYTTHDSHRAQDRHAWLGFLNLLKKHRTLRPINGIIVAISVQDIISQSPDERRMHAKAIRSRVDELARTFGVAFPVYVLLTKSDLIAGFSEYFAEFSRDQRDQVWGVTFPSSDHDESTSAKSFLDSFDQDFNHLLERIHQRVTWVMQRERDVQRRGMIQNFPSQLEMLKTPVNEFLKQTFDNNRYHVKPRLRGIYLTSATQEGTAIDRMMMSVASNFGVSYNAVSLPYRQGRSFFIQRLLTDVIFNESELVGVDNKFELVQRWARRGGYAVLAITCLAVVALWGSSFATNKSFIGEVGTQISQFESTENQLSLQDVATDTDTQRENLLIKLSPLLQATTVYEMSDSVGVSGLGLYDARVPEKADTVYLTQLNRLLVPQLVTEVEKRLLKMHVSDPALIETLRVYLMLEHEKFFNKDEILNWIQKSFSSSTLPPERTEQLYDHFVTLFDKSFKFVSLNASVVSNARDKIAQISVEQRIYQSLKNQPELSKLVDVSMLFGSNFKNVFVNNNVNEDLLVPVLFTKTGYDMVALNKRNPIVKRIIDDQWVMGSDQESFSDDELNKVLAKVKNLWMSEYQKRWHTLLNSLELIDIASISQASGIASSIADPVNSPFANVLNVISTNTLLTPKPSLQGLAGNSRLNRGKTKEVLDSGIADKALNKVVGEVYEPTVVDEDFHDIHNFTTKDSKLGSGANRAQDLIRALHTDLGQILLAPSPEAAAFKVVSKRFAGHKDTLSSVNASLDSQVPPVRRWMQKLANRTWRLILDQGQQHLNTVWRREVYAPFKKTLAGAYPFYKHSDSQATLLDFAEFFKPGGVEEQFFTQYLTQFIDRRKGWKVNQLEGEGLNISRSVLNQMIRAATIRKQFFRENVDSPAITFEMLPVSMDATVRRFDFSLNGQAMRYTHGPKIPQTIQWPSSQGEGRAVIVFEDLNGTQHRDDQVGPWALFKLLDSSFVVSTSRQRKYNVTFSKNGRKITYKASASSADNPFAQDVLSLYRCPEKL